MIPDRWQRVEAVFQEALDRPPQERASFLEQACRDDFEVKRETAILLAAHDQAGDFMEQPALVHDARVIFNETAAENIGREIGAYRLVDRLGAGGMGEVYLAEDNRLERLVALKLLPVHFASDDERLARFQREARAASALNHPNILTIHEVGEADSLRFIATEYIDGETVQELISRQHLTLTEILNIATQVASALAAAHAAGIVHRDVKPENIMRRADGLVKLLDFGIAKLLEAPDSDSDSTRAVHTEMGAVVGTVGYMSPEQARGFAIDERTDIWSLGVVLYQLLTHRLPFAGATRMDTLVNILEREPQPLFASDTASPELFGLEQLIAKSLRKDRGDRYQTANEVLNDLRSIRRELEKAEMSRADTLAETLPARSYVNNFSEHARTNTGKRSPGRYVFLASGLTVLLVAVIAGALLYGNRLIAKRVLLSRPSNSANSFKLYSVMTEAEQLTFISAEEQRISAMMGDRPGKLDDDALREIKKYVDLYINRRGSVSNDAGKEELALVYSRARPYLPTIARSFAARKVPVVIGIYLPLIESEYRPCFSNTMGAKGLFQFLPQTARRYGVAPEDRCDVEQMAPAAAHYTADHMAELGDDAESMTLVLLSYNQGATWVRGALRQVRDSENYERTFWTLFRNRDRLDESFRNEGAAYVPLFFAAAIIGENPRNFGLEMEPLSALVTQDNSEAR